MRVADFDFDLPESLIAQHPRPRGASRLLVVTRADGSWRETTIAALPQLLDAGDLLIVNDTRVFPARLVGRRDPSGGAAECLLLERVDRERVARARPSRAETETGRADGVRRPAARAGCRGARDSDRAPVFRQTACRARGRGRAECRRRRRRDRSRAAAAVRAPRGHAGRPRALSNGLRPRARIDRRADGRAALRRGAARGRCSARASRARR